jgi:O-glycosyl hydrolase
MLKTPALLCFVAATALAATEPATYNSAGALTSLIHDGAAIPVHGEFVVDFGHDLQVTLQPHDQKSPIAREGSKLHWSGVPTFPNGGKAAVDVSWSETDDGLALTGTAISGDPADAIGWRRPLEIKSVDYVIDLPRAAFAGGHVEPSGVALPTIKPADPVFFNAATANITLTDAQKNWTLALTLDHARPVTITDHWDATGRSYRIRIRLGGGLWPFGEPYALGLTLKLEGRASAPAAHVSIDPAGKRYEFDGFGGDYCFNTQTPAADYLMSHLRNAWARLEFKGSNWDRERAHPGPELVRDFELMQRVQRLGLPWILSLWRLPERYYTDPNRKPAGTFARQIAPDRWPEFLDLLGSYLTYLRANYGAEPDYFSFNEPDLGVDIGFSARAHRDMIKRLGAYLASRGLKTKMLLGDTANPRDSHRYVLPTAADPVAMSHVGAVSFHSWGGGSPAQYGAWADVASWLHLPLVVGEAGVNPGAYRNHTFDSYAYGLSEARQFQELLRDSRPTAILYWEFTEDYGLVHVDKNGSIEPTPRYWLMNQFANLTPAKSEVVTSASDQPDVLVSAFVGGETPAAQAVHILNVGPAREVAITGLPAGDWKNVVTTETEGLKPGPVVTATAKITSLRVPARSLTTLSRGVPEFVPLP